MRAQKFKSDHPEIRYSVRIGGTLTNNRVESGIITASYYGTSERHKGDNEGGDGPAGVRLGGWPMKAVSG